MKILLLGGRGQVGRELRERLPVLGDVIVATRDGCEADIAVDFSAPDSMPTLIQRIAPDVVINAVAYTAVDAAETDADMAYQVNAHTPAALAQACAEHAARLVHYSTDYVFDGQGQLPYQEDDATSPLGVYGASKLLGEQAIQASAAHYCILRTAWVYAAHGKNFLRTMLRLAQERNELRVVADQIGTPTSAAWIAEATVAIVQQNKPESGVWHLTAAGQASWHAFASEIMQQAHALGLLATPPCVLPITTADYPTPAKRPAWSVLNTEKLQRDFSLQPPQWQNALHATLRALARSEHVV